MALRPLKLSRFLAACWGWQVHQPEQYKMSGFKVLPIPLRVCLGLIRFMGRLRVVLPPLQDQVTPAGRVSVTPEAASTGTGTFIK
jgi:hypothetical protein